MREPGRRLSAREKTAESLLGWIRCRCDSWKIEGINYESTLGKRALSQN